MSAILTVNPSNMVKNAISLSIISSFGSSFIISKENIFKSTLETSCIISVFAALKEYIMRRNLSTR